MAFPLRGAQGLSALKWVSLVYSNVSVIANPPPLDIFLWCCYGGPLIYNALHKLNAIQAVFPAFFTLYISKECQSTIQVMQLSNRIPNPAGMWFGHLLFDSILGIIIVTVATAVFAATQSDQFRFIPLLVSDFSFTQLMI